MFAHCGSSYSWKGLRWKWRQNLSRQRFSWKSQESLGLKARIPMQNQSWVLILSWLSHTGAQLSTLANARLTVRKTGYTNGPASWPAQSWWGTWKLSHLARLKNVNIPVLARTWSDVVGHTELLSLQVMRKPTWIDHQRLQFFDSSVKVW